MEYRDGWDNPLVICVSANTEYDKNKVEIAYIHRKADASTDMRQPSVSFMLSYGEWTAETNSFPVSFSTHQMTNACPFRMALAGLTGLVSRTADQTEALHLGTSSCL